MPAPPADAATVMANGVSPSTPVTARLNLDNDVATAVHAAANSAGLGSVTFVGFHPDFCGLRLDPRMGGAPMESPC